MAKLCNGVPTDQPIPRNATAYCEGRRAAAAGALVGTNPHALDPDSANWIRGFDSWTADPAGLPVQDCCADIPGGGYIAP